jgi:NAD(P)-dependent dehydrogenase (short-subunit alcohol dehydrogenase family)
MGRSTALTLAREGADVALNFGTYRKSAAAAKQTARAIEKEFDRKAILLPADTTKAAACKKLVDDTVRSFGSIDIVVNNAGSPWEFLPIEKVKDDAWARSMAAEIHNAWYLTKYAIPRMRRRRYGRIFLLGMFRAQAWRGPPFDGTFGKAARGLLTEKLALALQPDGITVNDIAPGYIEWVPWKDAIAHAKGGPPAAKGMDRPVPQHAAEAIAWLCREEARWISGAQVPVWGAPPPKGRKF